MCKSFWIQKISWGFLYSSYHCIMLECMKSCDLLPVFLGDKQPLSFWTSSVLYFHFVQFSSRTMIHLMRSHLSETRPWCTKCGNSVMVCEGVCGTAVRQCILCSNLISDVDISPFGQQQVDQLLMFILNGPSDGSPSTIILHIQKL